MNVTVTLKIPSEKLTDLAKALAGLEDAGVPVPETPAVVAAPVESTAPEITKTMIRARGLELTKAGRSGDLEEVFKKFGADKLSGLKEENYKEAYDLMGELL